MTKITLFTNGKQVGHLKREEHSRARDIADRWSKIDLAIHSATLKKGKQKTFINRKG